MAHLVTMCNNYYIEIYHRDCYIISFTKNLKLIKIERRKDAGEHTHNVELYDKHYFDTLHIFLTVISLLHVSPTSVYSVSLSNSI